MPNNLFNTDWSNPANIAQKPNDGTGLNWSDQPSGQGLKDVVDQVQNEFVFLSDQLDATQAGKGLKHDNLANRAVEAENVREMKRQVATSMLFRTYTYNATAPYAPLQRLQRVSNGAVQYREIHKWQTLTNFRNFQVGVDNVTNEVCFEFDWMYYTYNNSPTPSLVWQENITPFSLPDDIVIGNTLDSYDIKAYKQIKVELQVSSNSNFATFQVADTKELNNEWINGSNPDPRFSPKFFSCKFFDNTVKSYQNCWYRIVMYLEQTPTMAINTTMRVALAGVYSIDEKITNKNL